MHDVFLFCFVVRNLRLVYLKLRGLAGEFVGRNDLQQSS